MEETASSTHSDSAGVTPSQALDEVPDGGFGAILKTMVFRPLQCLSKFKRRGGIFSLSEDFPIR
jgi:hypothetical protein